MMTITDSSIKIKCLKQRLFLLVSITSTNDGSHPFIKYVRFLTILDDGYKLQRRDYTDHGDVLTLNVRLLTILCMKLLLIKPNG
jgi:hypothetical protein